MFRRIFVPLDGTDFGDHALPYAISIAMRTGATMELAHVHHRVEADPRLTALPQYQFEHVEEASTRDDEDKLRKENAALEERAADIQTRFGVRVFARVLRGPTAHALAVEAADTVADLVVMTTHARTGLLRLRHGDLAHEFVGHLSIPTLCVRPPADDGSADSSEIRRILVTLDGSAFSEQILDMVVPLANAIDARLSLLHVVTPASRIVTGSNEVQRYSGDAIDYLGEVVAGLAPTMWEPELLTVEAGDAASAIITELSRSSHDALAIATHGRSGLSRIILGSVAEQVVRATHKPVLLYRPRIARLPADSIDKAFRIYGD